MKGEFDSFSSIMGAEQMRLQEAAELAEQQAKAERQQQAEREEQELVEQAQIQERMRILQQDAANVARAAYGNVPLDIKEDRGKLAGKLGGSRIGWLVGFNISETSGPSDMYHQWFSTDLQARILLKHGILARTADITWDVSKRKFNEPDSALAVRLINLDSRNLLRIKDITDDWTLDEYRRELARFALDNQLDMDSLD